MEKSQKEDRRRRRRKKKQEGEEEIENCKTVLSLCPGARKAVRSEA